MDNLNIEYISIDELKPFERNAKLHPSEQIRQIANSIEQFGMNDPIAIWKNNEIIEGHGRLLACKELGIKEVPVIRLDNLSDGERRAYMLVHNKTTMNSDFDAEILNLELTDLTELDFDMSDFGFSLDDIPDVLGNGKAEEDGYNEEPPAEPKAKPGDIYQLGEHRLMCGDATSAEDVARLMDGDRADICFTSPPYNMGASVGGGWDKAPNQAMGGGYAYQTCDDSMTRDEYESFLCRAVTNALANTDDALFNIGILSESKTAIIGMLDKFKDKFCDMIVWNKSASMPHGMESQRGMLSHRCEIIFAFNQNGSRSFTHPQWDKGTGINRIDTGNASGNEYSKIHNATFPVEFAYEVVRNFTESSCLDIFGGTGTTMIACEQMKRRCYMMELDPAYVDVIIDRWEKFTGNEAVKIEG